MSSYSFLSETRSRALTVNLNNFSYGGTNPLYSTFEYEQEQDLKFDTVHIRRSSSECEEDLFGYQDESDESDQEVGHISTITPFNSNTANTAKETSPSSDDTTNYNKNNITNYTSPKSMLLTWQNSVSATKSTSRSAPPKPPPRKVPNSPPRKVPKPPPYKSDNKLSHISSHSFHHFRLRSITINPNYNLDFDDISQAIDEFKQNISNQQDNDDNNTRHHRATGSVLIDGHPPLPTSPHEIGQNPDTKMIKYDITPKKKRKTVGFAANVVDPKRKYIEKEIIETEETYYRGLNTLLNELIMPMFDNELIDKKYLQQCTSNLPDLLSFHDSFLTQLVQVYEQKNDKNKNSSISQVFSAQNKDEFVNLYLTYIRDYDHICDLFGNTFHKNSKLQMFLKEKRRERKPLTNFLILPVQRVPRYILLLSDLKKHTLPSDFDYKNIECALELVHQIANEINERKRQIENMSQCLQIQEALSDLSESIVKIGREYQNQFVFIKKSHNHQRQFFCFTDIIIVTNHNWRVKHILDIRTVDIKLKVKSKTNLLKKKKSIREMFGGGGGGHGGVDDSRFLGNDDDDEKEHKFTEFVLLYLNKKPCCYISKTLEDFHEFESLIKQNRLMLIVDDLAKEKDTSVLRQTLKEQGVSQADDYQNEINAMKSKRRRGNASADKYGLTQSSSQMVYQ